MLHNSFFFLVQNRYSELDIVVLVAVVDYVICELKFIALLKVMKEGTYKKNKQNNEGRREQKQKQGDPVHDNQWLP